MNEITLTENHEYLCNGRVYPSVTTILSHFEMTTDYDSFGTDYSRDFGTVLHETCALLDEANLGEYDPAIEGRLNGYKKFLEMYKPEWAFIEVSLKDTIWGFAGTPDRYGVINKKPVILDIKSGKPDSSHELQTAGYQILIEEYGFKVKQRLTLYLSDNNYQLIEHKEKTDMSIFIGLAQAYNWKLRNGRIRRKNVT